MEGPAEARWRALVEARRQALEQLRGERPDDPWVAAANRFAPRPDAPGEALFEVMEPWLRPRCTLLDVGAGGGRHSVPLAARLDWVTAVEPSESMRAQLPDVPNLTVIAAPWADAEPAVADLVLCSHVLYGEPEPRAFVEKLVAHARERVFIVLRAEPRVRAAEVLASEWAGVAIPREPVMTDLFAVLAEMGIHADVATLPVRGTHRWATRAAAEAEVAASLGSAWRPDAGPARLAELLVEEGGEIVDAGSAAASQVAHWTPRT